MIRRPRFALNFAPETLRHFDAIECKYHKYMEEKIDEQFGCTPDRETRNRKRLQDPGPYGATWELRFGPANRFRVFYEVDASERIVWVLAVGVKERNKLTIGREVFEL